MRVQNEFTVSEKPFEPVMVFFRGMEQTSSADTKGKGIKSWHYDMSRLSQGIKCATQGCKYNKRLNLTVEHSSSLFFFKLKLTFSIE